MRYRPGMAARTPRRSFAAPFVVTLAAAPACYVSNAPPPQQPPPAAPAEQAPHNAPGVVVANPPRPQPENTPVAVANPPRPQDQNRPVVVANPPRPQDPPVPAAPQDHPVVVANPPRPHAHPAGTTWHVFKAGDGCEAAVHVDCPKGAMCNPPPPRKVDCPAGLTMPKGLDIVSQGDGTCIVAQEPVHCPPHAMCNPPRPRSVACPE